jgi:hypothetical protein
LSAPLLAGAGEGLLGTPAIIVANLRTIPAPVTP